MFRWACISRLAIEGGCLVLDMYDIVFMNDMFIKPNPDSVIFLVVCCVIVQSYLLLKYTLILVHYVLDFCYYNP